MADLVHVDLPSEKAAETAEALAELSALGRAVGDELNLDVQLRFIFDEVLDEVLLAHQLIFCLLLYVTIDEHLLAGLRVHVADVLLLTLLKDLTIEREVFPGDDRVNRAHFQTADRVDETVAVSARVLSDVVQKLLDDVDLLQQLHVVQNVRTQFDCLLETSFHAVSDINLLDDTCLDTRVQKIRLGENVLEVGATRENDSVHVQHIRVLVDEESDAVLGDDVDVVVARFQAQTGETD